MVERTESPSVWEIKAYEAKAPENGEKVRVIINVMDWKKVAQWEKELEGDINKAWMKKRQWI